MQIRHLKSLGQSAATAPTPNDRINAISWSPNNQKLAAVCASDRIIQLFDDTGERKDRFSTKPADPQKATAKQYQIIALAFSPDSTRLAIAQSDCVVFVYKLGLEWGEKKSICNKLIQTSEITCMTWPKSQINSLVFGMADGKVRVGNLKTNKAATLYQTESYVVSTTSSPDGNAIISGHADGSINRFFFDDGVSGASQGAFTIHRCAPDCLAWGEQVVASGCDRVVVFYTLDGKVSQQFDYSNDDSVLDFTCAEFNPSGQSLVMGNYNRFHIYNYSTSRGNWDEAAVKIISNFYTVTAISWKPDGSRLAASNMCGAIELFDCCLRRSRYKGKFEFTYVSPSQLIVKRLSTGSRIVLKSHYGYEIVKVDIFQDQFLVANTSQTLLLGDLASCKLSEVSWVSGGNEKYYFENPVACMVFNAGELSLIEYGINEILGSCRTEYMNPHLISVRINDRPNNSAASKDIKKVAYLIDIQTINILNLVTGQTIGNITHDVTIDWLELSGKGDRLLFRDKRHQLHLYDVETQNRVTLLAFCTYVQWVPKSDVIVAQSRTNLCVWYNVAFPERITMFTIKGDVEDIESIDGKTEVVVDEGVNTVSYTLDESLIEFGASMDDCDWERGIALLERLDAAGSARSSDCESMWKSLAQAALKNSKLEIAERCFAAVGDIATSRYLRELSERVRLLDADPASGGYGIHHYSVRAKLAMLDKQFKMAEGIYLEQGKVDEAMSMYQEMHKWNLSIKVAELKSHPELETLKKNYYTWLIDSGQEDQAAEMKEEEHDFQGAIQLYLKAGKASQILLSKGLTMNIDLTERIAAALFKSSLYEKAGELFERLGSNDRALDSYKKGKAYRAAIELSRITFPQQVVSLEEQWGDHLVSQKQMDAAINHYIEAGKSQKAVEAAIAARQWKKAVGIIETMQPSSSTLSKAHILQIAKHFDDSAEHKIAEKFYVMGGRMQDAVDMYTRADKWDKAHALASTFMSAEEVSHLYISHARDLESQGRYKDAERLYLTIGEPDLAITMYKNHKQYDHMIRLVSSHHKDLLVETHLYLARTLESEGNLRQAEHYYIEGKDWKGAINMYCANNMYEEAYKVAKTYGGASASKQVAYLWARSLGGEAAVKLLTKFSLLEAAIDYAVENGSFDFAFELSRFTQQGSGDNSKIATVHYKHAMFLEDEGKYKEAEAAFLQAGKPKEAILMHTHNESWAEAIAIAEKHDPDSLAQVLMAQAKKAFETQDYGACESLLLRAQRPDIVLIFYKSADMWDEAMKFAREYFPTKLVDLQAEEREKKRGGQGLSNGTNGNTDHDSIIASAKNCELQKEYSRAIDLYMRLPKSCDLKILETCWIHAVSLATKFCGPDKIKETIKNVSTGLLDIKRFDSAAQVLINAGEMYKEALDCYIMGGLWDKARHLVGKSAPKYSDYIENAYKSSLQSNLHSNSENTGAQLELLASRGEWQECLDIAMTVAPKVLDKYLLTYCGTLIKEGRHEVAMKQIIKCGVPVSSPPQCFDVYTRITREVLHHASNEGITMLRKMLYSIVYNGAGSRQIEIPPTFQGYLMITHLLNLYQHCKKSRELVYFAAKIAIALLRYTRDIPIDGTFYEAGLAAKAAGMDNMAFVCWNRYLDISEAIEEGDVSIMLDNSDFEQTDVPCEATSLPAKNLLPENEREQVRDWILQVSLDQRIQQELDRRLCEECGTSIYDASLQCNNCSIVSEPCVITGYPLGRSRVNCTVCNCAANKEDWNKFVLLEKACPWCSSSQSPIYSLQKQG